MDILDVIQKHENERGIDWFINHVENIISNESPYRYLFEKLIQFIHDPTGRFIYSSDSFCSNNSLEINLNRFKIKFRSSYFAARIIGKKGIVIKQIKQISQTEIISPQFGSPVLRYCHQGGHPQIPTNSFAIISPNPKNCIHALSLIIKIGMVFVEQFIIKITPPPGQNCLKMEVNPNCVALLLNRNGLYIKFIQWATSVKIISPKPYAPPCIFYLIGEKNTIQFVKDLISQMIKEFEETKTKIKFQRKSFQ